MTLSFNRGFPAWYSGKESIGSRGSPLLSAPSIRKGANWANPFPYLGLNFPISKMKGVRPVSTNVVFLAHGNKYSGAAIIGYSR